MSKFTRAALLEFVEGDQELLQLLIDNGILDAQPVFSQEDVEALLISRTLVREMGINWQGVDVILRLRKQLLFTRLRLAELASDDT